MKNTLRTSLTRIARFTEGARIKPLPREKWGWGDYVACEVVEAPGPDRWIELPNGRLIQVAVGDLLLGALGTRFATLALTGTWKQIGPEGRMQVLTAAGLFGKVTSLSPFEPTPIELQYRGHVMAPGSTKARMRDYAVKGSRKRFRIPVLLVLGSSMSCGKTQAARILIRRLKQMNLKVLAAKLTGAGRFRDVLSMKDAGADAIFDFVDAGLPSTVCSEAMYRTQIGRLLSAIAEVPADVLVVEAGASPLEPYNGATAAALLAPHVRFCLLCCTDPYAAVALIGATPCPPDLIGGMACNTVAGIELLRSLCDIPGRNLSDPANHPALDALLAERFGRGAGHC